MSPKFTLYDPLTARYLAWTKVGPSWLTEWKHATKWESQYKAKLFMEANNLFGVVPLQVLPKKVDVGIPRPAKQVV